MESQDDLLDTYIINIDDKKTKLKFILMVREEFSNVGVYLIQDGNEIMLGCDDVMGMRKAPATIMDNARVIIGKILTDYYNDFYAICKETTQKT